MKIKHFLPLLLLLGSNEMLTAQEIALTPQPAHLTVKDGRFEFGNQLKAKVTPYQGDSIHSKRNCKKQPASRFHLLKKKLKQGLS